MSNEIPIGTNERKPGLMLLRLPRGADEPLYIIVEQSDWGGDEFAQYAIDEGQCPTNIVPVKAFIDGEDTDPHGLLEYVQWVPRPPAMDVYPRTEDREFWRRIFSRLPKSVEAGGEG